MGSLQPKDVIKLICDKHQVCCENHQVVRTWYLVSTRLLFIEPVEWGKGGTQLVLRPNLQQQPYLDFLGDSEPQLPHR